MIFAFLDCTAQELFSPNRPLELSLTVSFQDFVDNIEEDEYVDGEISYLVEGNRIVKEVRLKARGHFRLKHCMIPPIKIHFNDDNYGIPLLDDLGKVKMVTGCTDKPVSQEYLVKEFITYQMYQKLTEYSLSTYFMNVEFINADDTTDRFSSYSFLIQDIDELAEQKGGIEVSTQKLSHDELDDNNESLMTLFDYMIGNLDLYVYNLHNIKLIQIDGKKPIPVPYDFDFSGFVNTDYAYASKEHGQKTVRDRFYVGSCRSPEEYEELFSLFEDHHSDFDRLIMENQYIVENVKSDVVGYIGEFYDIIGNQRMAKKKIVKKCWD